MKKYFITLLFIIIITPSVALASWWNPFTWKIFNRSPEVKIEKPITPPINSTNTSAQTKEESEKIKLETELEQAKAEATKAKAEKEKIQREAKTAKVRAEAEKAQREEEARVKAEQERLREAQRLADQQVEEERVMAQNAQIKIEICKIEAQTSIKNFLEAGKLAANEGYQKCVQSRIAAMGSLSSGGASPGVLSSMYSLARSSCNNSAKEGFDFLQSKADEMYNQRYVECLNK